ncbi:MAG: hypothetical protein KatS3mg118_2449 [Paracoccaceae bacterium]|nr:MAG: hypothetical protein KatS3mg118_2449 [Paracoccaceae bacterium]
MLNPHLPTRMIWAEGTRQVLVQIDRAAMQRHLAGLLGGPPDRPLTFLGPLDLESGAGAAFRRLVMWLVAEADCGACPIGPGLMGAQIEATLLAGLLEGCAHDHAGAIARVRAAPRPRHLRLAEAYVEAHLDRPLTLDEIAAAAGVSPRALQMAFRRFRGTTPLAFLRDLRLARAHAELSAGAPGTTVTGVALKWGFGHFGRFAGQYRARYGLSPSDTLKAARG